MLAINAKKNAVAIGYPDEHVSEISRSPTGKIEKPKLRKKFTGKVEALDADILGFTA
jgi:hypothetical protein